MYKRQGVNKAKADYECGRKLTVYICPDGGAVASSELSNRVDNLLSQRAPMTTWLKVKSAGKVQIILEMGVNDADAAGAAGQNLVGHPGVGVLLLNDGGHPHPLCRPQHGPRPS